MVLLTSNDWVLKLGDSAPSFSLKDTEDKEYTLTDFKNKKAILIIFMCNHCPYVKPKMDFFVELQNNHGTDGLQVVAINSNDQTNYEEDSFDMMKKVANERKFSFPYLIDETQDVAREYGAVCTPDPFLFDSDFKLAYHGRVDDAHAKTHSEAKSNDLEDAILKVLSKQPINIRQHPSIGCSIKWRE